MRSRFPLRPSTQCLVFFVGAAGCGRSALLALEHTAPAPTDASVPVDQAKMTADAGSAGSDVVRSMPCPPATFDHDGTPATPCKPWTDCRPGQYVGVQGTPLADRQCYRCASESFSAQENAEACTPWRRCDGWTLTEKSPGTSSSDRVCQVSDGIRGTGTPEDDVGTGIAVDDQGNVVIVGNSNGSLAGAALGSYDAFVRKLDARGDVVWTRQFGTEREDQALAVALDGDGGVFVVGHTAGALAGTSNGEVDAFVRKYDRSGGVAWTRQFGTADWDRAYAVAVDAKGNATVAGATNDATLDRRPFLRTYAPNGDLLRSYDLDLPSTIVYAVAVDASGSIYLAGASSGEIEGPRAGGLDAILMKLDQEGYVAWTRQYGTTNTDEALAVAIDRGGNPWVVGYKNAGSQGGGPRSGEGFVRKYDPRGTLVFSYSIDDSWWQGATGVAVDSRGRGFVVGNRIVPDPIRSTVSHAYVEELDAQGTLQEPLRMGDDPNQASAAGVAVGPSEKVYVLVNACYSPFAGHPVVGRCDAFVAEVQ